MSMTKEDIAAIYKADMVANGNHSKAEDHKATYEKTLPESFGETAVEQYKAHDKHNVVVMQGASLGMSEACVDNLKANPTFAHATAEVKIGNQTLSTMVERRGTVNIPGRNGEPTTSKEVVGYTTLKVKTNLGAEGKRIRNHIADLAEKALG